MKHFIRKIFYLIFCVGSVLASEDKDEWVEWESTPENGTAYFSMVNNLNKELESFILKHNENTNHDCRKGKEVKKEESEESLEKKNLIDDFFRVKEDMFAGHICAYKIAGHQGDVGTKSIFEDNEISTEKASNKPTNADLPASGTCSPFDIFPLDSPEEKSLSGSPHTIVKNYGEWPYRLTGRLRLFFTQQDIDEEKPDVGTGFLVGPATVLTAAHNIFNIVSDSDGNFIWKWAQKVNFYPAFPEYNEFASVCKIYCKKGWLNQHHGFEESKGAGDYDMALLILDKPMGLKLGWSALRTFNYDNHYKIRVWGYPFEPSSKKDDERIPNKDMISSDGEIKYDQYDRGIIGERQNVISKGKTKEVRDGIEHKFLVKYSASTRPGHSGSGCYVDEMGGDLEFIPKSHPVICIHTRSLKTEGNAGVLLRKQDLDQISLFNKQIAHGLDSDDLWQQIRDNKIDISHLVSTIDSFGDTDRLTLASSLIRRMVQDEEKITDIDFKKSILFYASFLKNKSNGPNYDGDILRKVYIFTENIVSLAYQEKNITDFIFYILLGRDIIGTQKVYPENNSSSSNALQKHFLPTSKTYFFKPGTANLSYQDIKQIFKSAAFFDEERFENFHIKKPEKIVHLIRDLFSGDDNQKKGIGWCLKSPGRSKINIKLRGYNINKRDSSFLVKLYGKHADFSF